MSRGIGQDGSGGLDKKQKSTFKALFVLISENPRREVNGTINWLSLNILLEPIGHIGIIDNVFLGNQTV